MSMSGNKSFKLWAAGILAIAAVWTLAAVANWGLAQNEPSTEKLRVWLEQKSFDELSPAEREKFLQEYAQRINRLSMDERRKAREEEVFRRSFESMTEPEQGAFLEATLPNGMRQMMEAFETMEPDERERWVQRALRDLDKVSSEELEEGLQEAHSERVVKFGLKSYYEDASAQTRLELAPLMEQLQKRLRRIR